MPNTQRSDIKAPAATEEPLPEVVTPLEKDQIISRLEAASKRGKLAGWQSPSRRTPPAGAAFALKDFGHPFESILLARASAEPQGGTRLAFSIKLQRTLPIVYWAVMVASVWPGCWLTDSMLRTYFTGYDYNTYLWYLPLTAPFVPWTMWSLHRKSSRSAREEARDLIRKVESALA